MRTDDIVTTTLADFQRNIGRYQDQALTPVAITKNGRPRTVLISAFGWRMCRDASRELDDGCRAIREERWRVEDPLEVGIS
jgi:PHD/YefM family antitoxin component YafN of YafNO toxin-antitoxin module